MADTSLLRASVLTVGGVVALGWATAGIMGALVGCIAAMLLILILARERPQYGPQH